MSSAKPHVNVAILGHAGHGATTLAAAISKVQSIYGLADAKSYEEVKNATEYRENGITFAYSQIEVESDKRAYTLTDFKSYPDAVKVLTMGTICFDGAILVVDVDEGPMPQTHDLLNLAHQAGIPAIVTLINKCDLIESEDEREFFEALVLGIESMVEQYGYSWDEATLLPASAVAALEDPTGDAGDLIAENLMNAMDNRFPVPEQTSAAPFLMSVEDAFFISGRGVVASGHVERGSVSVGDTVDIVGLADEAKQAKVAAIQKFRQIVDHVEAGDDAGVVLEGVVRRDVDRGQVLAAPGSIKACSRFAAQVHVLSREEGGRHTPLFNGWRPQVHVWKNDTECIVSLSYGNDICMPGDTTRMEIEPVTPLALEPGMDFLLREGGRVVAKGRVIEVLG